MPSRRFASRAAAACGTSVAGLALALAPAMPAHASNCKITSEGYSHHKIQVCGTTYNRHHATVVTHQGSGYELPFTGADVVLMTTVGAGLIAGGTMLAVGGRRRRASKVAA